MNIQPIAVLPYDNVQFRFVSSHYDIHLEGSCDYNGKLHRFSTKGDCQWDEEEDEWLLPDVNIYSLSWGERWSWRWRQFAFEKSVGYHWSYKNGLRGKNFYYRKPEWLYKRIFKLYYKLKTK